MRWKGRLRRLAISKRYGQITVVSQPERPASSPRNAFDAGEDVGHSVLEHALESLLKAGAQRAAINIYSRRKSLVPKIIGLLKRVCGNC